MWSSVARNALVLSVLATIAGCAGTADEETGSGDSEINLAQQAGPSKDLPEAVLIAVGSRDFCTGVLIAPKLVLTATHCNGSSYSVTAPFAPGGSATSTARPAGQVDGDYSKNPAVEDVKVLKLDKAIQLAAYPEARDVGELGNRTLHGVAVGRDREKRVANLVKSVVVKVTSGSPTGYTTGLNTDYYSGGGDSGGPLFLSDATGKLVVPHVVIGIERQPEPNVEPNVSVDHFTRITANVKSLVASSQ